MSSCGAHYTGIDITRRHLELAEANFYRKKLPGTFLYGDLTDLNLPDGSFDVVYSFGVLHHIEHEARMIAEVRRLLVDDGLFLYAVYSKYSFFNVYMFARWLLSPQWLCYPFVAFQAHLAEGCPLDRPVTIKVRNKRDVMKLLGPHFEIVSYQKKGFVQNYIPCFGKYLKPDGWILNILGRAIGWYHVIIARKSKHV
jgi:SAM-dependent methyltransferase